MVIERIARALVGEGSVEVALDVACGTGLSTVPLTRMARRVVGIDSSIRMITRAAFHPAVRYCVGSAEKLPFRSGAFDLVTVSSAIHWFDAGLFLAEARRIAHPGAVLVVYDNYFTGETIEDPAFFCWFRESYLRDFPSPPRDRRAIEEIVGRTKGFSVEGAESYESIVRFTLRSLVDYLLTQTNVIARVEGGGLLLATVAARFRDELAQFFEKDEKRSFRFGGPIVYARIRAREAC